MLVVISDLHFEEERLDELPAHDGHPAIDVRRNFPGRAFEIVFEHLAALAWANGARKLVLVLAGDIFDLYRTQRWFDSPVRPYQSCSAVSPELETKLLDILAAIAREERVRDALTALRRLKGRRYVRSTREGLEEADFPAEVEIHYLPGNHDRLANGTPAIRRRIRQLLGLDESDAPFPHTFPSEDPRALVRHGHEYDRFTFSEDYESDRQGPLPATIPESAYAAAPLGDLLTIDVAARLPHLLRRLHSPAEIVADRTLRAVYRRLLEFDDVRPQAALLEFLTTIPGHSERALWETLRPLTVQLLDELASNPFLDEWLDRLERGAPLSAIGAAHGLLSMRAWRLGLPLPLVRWVGGSMAATTPVPPAAQAAREPTILSGEHRFLIAGHTHAPDVVTLSTANGFDQLYLDTGTFRNQLRRAVASPEFVRVKSLTYVVVYASDEDRRRGGKSESFDLWSGVSQRWAEPPSEA